PPPGRSGPAARSHRRGRCCAHQGVRKPGRADEARSSGRDPSTCAVSSNQTGPLPTASRRQPPADSPFARAVERVRVTFPQISSRAWEHPADRAALSTLRQMPGFGALLRTAAGVFSERRLRLLHLATSVRAGDQQFRSVHEIKQDCVRILDVEFEPELYVAQDPRPNAVTLGLDRPFVVLTTGLLDLLDDEELRVV